MAIFKRWSRDWIAGLIMVGLAGCGRWSEPETGLGPATGEPQNSQVSQEPEDATQLSGPLFEPPLLPIEVDAGQSLVALRAVAWSPDGARLATGDASGLVTLHDIPSQSRLWLSRVHNGACNDLAFLPDGRIVSVGADRTLLLLRAGDGSIELSTEDHLGAVHGVAVTADGGQIITVSADRRVLARSTSDGTVVELGRHDGQVMAVTVAREGTLVASSGQDRTVRIWDLENPRAGRIFSSPGTEVITIHFSPKADRLITGTYDGVSGIWDVASGQRLSTRSSFDESSITSAWFTLDHDRFFVGTGSGRVTLHAVAARNPIQRLPLGYAVSDLALSPDGSLIAVALANGDAVVLALGEGLEQLHTFTPEAPPGAG